MKSTLLTMTVSLCGVALLAGAGLAGVNVLTEKPIAEAQAETRRQAIAEILPPFDNVPSDETVVIDGLTLFPASKSGKSVGAAVETFSDNGFSGRITILAGFDECCRLTGFQVLTHAETPGLGARMSEWFSSEGSTHNVAGMSAPFALKADGGDIDAITGATISSRAFMEAINKASEAVTKYQTER